MLRKRKRVVGVSSENVRFEDVKNVDARVNINFNARRLRIESKTRSMKTSARTLTVRDLSFVLTRTCVICTRLS